jgi:hypothetical protein
MGIVTGACNSPGAAIVMAIGAAWTPAVNKPGVPVVTGMVTGVCNRPGADIVIKPDGTRPSPNVPVAFIVVPKSAPADIGIDTAECNRPGASTVIAVDNDPGVDIVTGIVIGACNKPGAAIVMVRSAD